MKKPILYRLIIVAVVGLCFGFFTSSVSALSSVRTSYQNFASFIPACSSGHVASGTPVCSDVQTEYSSNGNLVVRIIKDVINVVSYIVGVAAIVIIIISGLRMIASGGEANTVKESKMGLFAAVIGIMVVALAQSFVIFVLDKLG